MTPGVNVSNNLLRTSLGEAMASFDSPAGQAMQAHCAERAAAGDVQAYYVPAVKYMLDSTLAVVENPEVADGLSREVFDRHGSATWIASHIADTCARNRSFLRLYANSPLASIKLSGNDLVSLLNTEYLESLAAVPFYDVQKVCGGALQLLGEAKGAAAIIGRSAGLLAISGIFKPRQDIAHRYLGHPYVKVERLELQGEADTRRVSFTRPAQARLAKWTIKGRGCPAGRTPGTVQPTLLEDYWPRIVNCLVPPDATANRQQQV